MQVQVKKKYGLNFSLNSGIINTESAGLEAYSMPDRRTPAWRRMYMARLQFSLKADAYMPEVLCYFPAGRRLDRTHAGAGRRKGEK